MRTQRVTGVVLIVLALLLATPIVSRAQIITTPFTEMGDGAVVIEFDHNRGNGNVLRFRCINNSAYDALLRVYTCPDGQCTLVGSDICDAGTTEEINVPGISIRWECVLNDPDHPEWGWDCGLVMGDYVFSAAWPY